MKKVLSSLVLGVSLLAPLGLLQAQNHREEVRHEWNDGENASWHRYLAEHHKKDHDWVKAKKREQADYWKWRDQHRDH